MESVRNENPDTRLPDETPPRPLPEATGDEYDAGRADVRGGAERPFTEGAGGIRATP